MSDPQTPAAPAPAPSVDGVSDAGAGSSSVSVSVSTSGDAVGLPPPLTPPVVIERPTVGRRCYYWSGSDGMEAGRGLTMIEANQPFDAGVLYVHPPREDGHHYVNLMVTDHYGAQRPVHDVRLLNPFNSDEHHAQEQGYATWMPYQVKKGTGSS